MKNSIGKDLSKIPIPVNFSEPLSFLQRLNEDFEYSEILDRASNAADDYEQLALVAAFTVSSYRYGDLKEYFHFHDLRKMVRGQFKVDGNFVFILW